MMIPQSLQQAAEAFAQHANTYAPLFSAPTSTLGPVGRTSATPQAVSPYAKSVTGPNIPEDLVPNPNNWANLGQKPLIQNPKMDGIATQPTVDAVSGPSPMVSAPLSATPVTQEVPVTKTTGIKVPSRAGTPSEMNLGGNELPTISQASAPVTAPGGLDMQTIIGGLLSLVEGGLRTASGYHQGLSGDQGPTAWDKTLERQQALKLQQNQLAQQVAIQSAQFKFDTDMKKLDRQLQLDLQSAGNDFAKQQITAQGDVNRNLLWQGLEKQIQLIQRVYGGRDITQTGGQSPTINDLSQMLAVTK
jgi:hypothetical protein